MTSSWARYILGPVYAFLPKRWRYLDHHGSASFMARCTMFSGLIESFVALLVLRIWYVNVLGMLSDAYAKSVLDDARNLTVVPEVFGGAGFIVFASNPITWLILYFGLEGILRMTTAVVSGECYGILPFYVLDFVYTGVLRLRRPRQELTLVRDEILRGDDACDLKIASCRKRPDWKYPFAIRYGGAYFQVIALESTLLGARPYIYALRRLPPGEIARGLRDYDPDDVLYEVPRIAPLG
jgi:hypothetical protein